MAGVHGLQHVKRFFATHLAQNNAVGPHAQCVDHEFALPDCALPFEVRWAALQTRNVLLLNL